MRDMNCTRPRIFRGHMLWRVCAAFARTLSSTREHSTVSAGAATGDEERRVRFVPCPPKRRRLTLRYNEQEASKVEAVRATL